MGITVTTNLALIKPDTNESIKQNLPSFNGWASQNAANCDKVDSLFRATTHSYTPLFTASGVNPTLGAGGFVEGKFARIFPRMVMLHFRIYVGAAGFATGTGNYFLSLPAAAPQPVEFAQFINPVGLAVGKAVFSDNSAVATSSVFAVIYNPPTSQFYFRDNLGDTFSTTSGTLLGQDDRISGYCMYPTSAV